MIIACRECGARFTPPEPPPVVTICGLCERERLAKLRRLRAAAPDLLAALRDLLATHLTPIDHMDEAAVLDGQLRYDRAIVAARAALAKAEKGA